MVLAHIRLLRSINELAAGDQCGYAIRCGLHKNTVSKVKSKLMGGDLRIEMGTIKKLARPEGRMPFILRRGVVVEDFGQPELLTPDAFDEYFLAFFVNLRGEMTYSALARLLTRSSGIIFNNTSFLGYERGDHKPELHRLEAMARFDGLIPDYLVPTQHIKGPSESP